MNDNMITEQKIALITGGSRGIGRAVVVRLAQDGFFTYINYLNQEEKARETLSMAQAAGGAGDIYRCNVSDYAETAAMVEHIVASRGRLDILVNNAGINYDGLLVRMAKEKWDRMIATNIGGLLNCCQLVIKPMLKRRWGRIVTVTSVVAEGGNAGQSVYAATKAAVLGLTTSLAKELGGRNICINAVSPGFIETDLTRQLNEKERGRILNQIPLGRPGNPEDVANLVAFLVSEKAGYITGQVIRVNGGLYM